MKRLLSIFALTAAISAAQSVSPTSADDFQKQVLPVLTKTCVTCHNDRLQTAGFSFEPFRDAASAARKPELWQKVLDKLSAGQMPPAPMAALSAADLATVTGWIRKLSAIVETPGRVTAR